MKKIVPIGAATVLYAMNVVALSPVVARMTSDGTLTHAGSGLLFTVHFAGFIVFALLGAFAADKVGKKRVLVWALVGYSAGFLLFALLNAFWLDCIVMFLLGGCGGIVECLGAALAADLSPQNEDHAVNLIQIFFAVGAMAAPLLAALFLSRVPFWKSFYLLLAALALVVAVVMSRSQTDAPGGGSSQRLRLKSLACVLREPGFLLMCLCMFAYTGSEVGTWGWLSSLLQQKAAFTMVQSGLGVSLFWLAMTVGRSVSGKLLPRLGARKLVLILALFSTAVSVVAVFAQDVRLLLAVVVCIGLGCSSQFPLIATSGSRLTVLPSGAAFSLLMVCGNLGSSVIPLAMGGVGDAAGLAQALWVPVAMFGLVGIVMLLYRGSKSGKTLS